MTIKYKPLPVFFSLLLGLLFHLHSEVFAQTSIPCGKAKMSSLLTIGEKDSYTFKADAGDAVTIRAIITTGDMNPYIELLDPSGTRIASSYSLFGNYASIDKSLTISGAYTILVSDNGNDEKGDYELIWQKLNNLCESASINCGQAVSSTLRSPGEQNFYSFVADAGDSITLRLIAISGDMRPYLELYDPTGTQLAYNYSRFGNFTSLDKTLIMGGTYTIVVSDNGNKKTGGYNLTWQKLNNPCNATVINCGQTISNSLLTKGEQHFYVIPVTAGDDITLLFTKTPAETFVPYVDLYDKTGKRITYNHTYSESQLKITQTLNETGFYTLIVSDYGYDKVGSYTLKFQKNNNSCPEVAITSPNGNETFEAGTSSTISWTTLGSRDISFQEIRFSTDGGRNFPIKIATGLAGNIHSFKWDIPNSIVTSKGRIRVIAVDNTGISTSDESDADFVILQKNVPKDSYVYGDKKQRTNITPEDTDKNNPITVLRKGKISGHVSDNNDNPVSGATLNIIGKKSKTKKTAISNGKGDFEFIDLEADIYILIANKSSYKDAKQSISLETQKVNKTTTIDNN